jgi:hypothetical protein
MKRHDRMTEHRVILDSPICIRAAASTGTESWLDVGGKCLGGLVHWARRMSEVGNSAGADADEFLLCIFMT